MLLPEKFRVKKPSVRLLANWAGVLVMPPFFCHMSEWSGHHFLSVFRSRRC